MSCEVRLAPAAARQFRKQPPETRERIRAALHRLAEQTAPGHRGGKGLKKLRGSREDFFRLRVGDHRIIFDVLEGERIVLVLGVMHRRDLERWLRQR